MNKDTPITLLNKKLLISDSEDRFPVGFQNNILRRPVIGDKILYLGRNSSLGIGMYVGFLRDKGTHVILRTIAEREVDVITYPTSSKPFISYLNCCYLRIVNWDTEGIPSECILELQNEIDHIKGQI